MFCWQPVGVFLFFPGESCPAAIGTWAKLITLLTDFGHTDTFVGQMNAVIWSINPQAIIVDRTYEIPPQDVRLAAALLARSLNAFPPGMIHVAVVTPGVGSARPQIAVEAEVTVSAT